MKIFLKKNEERRIKSGHQWIFSNEILKTEGDTENGDICDLYSNDENYIGKGFYNKNSLISFRLLTKNKNDEINKAFFSERLKEANSRRYILGRNVYRMVNSESDFLPGLIIDRFDKAYSIQIFSFGMNRFLDILIEILIEDFNAEYITEKDDNEMRILEGLDKINKILYRKNEDITDEFIVNIDEIKYSVNLLEGQKTGFYLDQIENRKLIRQFIKKNDNVLDLFCNEGGFALNAGYSGASSVIAVDSSEYSLDVAKKNSILNKFNNINFIRNDVFDYLEKEKDQIFDFIILDPPSFAKSKKYVKAAVNGYIKLNAKAMRLLKPESFLFTFSCSHHISEEIFRDIICKSAEKSERKVQILYFSNSSVDHPVIPGFDETMYLKSCLLRII